MARCLLFGVYLCGFFFLFQAAMQVEIKTVKVSGNEYVKDAQIIKNAGFNESVKYFGFKSKKVCEDVVSDPLIKSCKIKRGLGFQIEIVVEENIPLFFYSSESSIVLSDKSFVDGTNLYGLPIDQLCARRCIFRICR